MYAEGVYYLQPRVARVSALPWVMSEYEIATLKGLAKAAAAGVELAFTKVNRSWPTYSQPFQGWDLFCLITQGSALACATLG